MRKRYLGIISERARAAAISRRPGGTDFDLSKILEAEEHGGKFEAHEKSRKLNDDKFVDFFL